MNPQVSTSWIAFARAECVASGVSRDVAAAAKKFVDAHPDVNVLVLDAVSSHPVEIDLRGTLATVLKRLPVAAANAPDPQVLRVVVRRTHAVSLGVSSHGGTRSRSAEQRATPHPMRRTVRSGADSPATRLARYP
jgi:hypothetical protein